MKITFVCVGNMCRSPLLEQMFAAYAAANDFECECDSAGLMDHEVPMSPESVLMLKERGITPVVRNSKLLTKELFHDSDLIVTMTDAIMHKVFEHYGKGRKIISLSATELLGEEVEDPYGESVETYRSVAAQFDEALPRLLAFSKNY